MKKKIHRQKVKYQLLNGRQRLYICSTPKCLHEPTVQADRQHVQKQRSVHCTEFIVLGPASYLQVTIYRRTPMILNFQRFSSGRTGKYFDNSSIRQRPLPSKPFPIHQRPITPQPTPHSFVALRES